MFGEELSYTSTKHYREATTSHHLFLFWGRVGVPVICEVKQHPFRPSFSQQLRYMTNGVIVALGDVGRNVAAGMSGGILYLYSEAGHRR